MLAILIIPYTSPDLLRNEVKHIAVSPFTLVFFNAGLLSTAAVMNSVIPTAVLSAGNFGMYASTRMLYAVTLEGKAPKIFSTPVARQGATLRDGYDDLGRGVVLSLLFYIPT